MEVVILPGTKQIGALAADAIEALVRRKPNAVLGLATGGSSPLPSTTNWPGGTRQGGDWTSARRMGSLWMNMWGGSKQDIPSPTARSSGASSPTG